MQCILLLGIDARAELCYEATKQKSEVHWSLRSAFSLCVVITFSPIGLQRGRESQLYFSLRSYFMAWQHLLIALKHEKACLQC